MGRGRCQRSQLAMGWVCVALVVALIGIVANYIGHESDKRVKKRKG